jgi:hypothetical protein
MARAIDWARYDQLKAQGHSERDIAGALDIPRTTLRRELEKREAQPTQVHLGVPMPNDLAGRLLSLLPELEAMVTRERDCQRLLSTPIGTPRHTLKKTYVVDTLYIDLIGRYARAEGLELKDVVNLALHEFFERRRYLPEEA